MIDRASDALGVQRPRVARPSRVITYIITAVAYMAAYLALREASNDQWYLPAGLRFAALLAAPYRLWPALFIGDVMAVASFRLGMVAEYGLTYYAGSSVAAWPVVAIVVRQLRRISELPKLVKATDAVGLIVAALCSAEFVSVVSKAAAAYLKHGGGAIKYGDLIVYSLGDVQGILLASFVLVLAVNCSQPVDRPRAFLGHAGAAVGVCGALAVAMYVISPADAALLMAMRLFLLVPALVLTFRHGWRGAAVGAIAAQLALFSTIPHQPAGSVDGSALLMQEAFVFVSAALFVLGARGQVRAADASTEDAARVAQRQAREHIEATERRHRDAALRAEAMQRDSREGLEPMVAMLRRKGQSEVAMNLVGLAHAQSSRFGRTIVDSIYPLTLERVGLFAAVESEAFELHFRGTPFTFDMTGSHHGLALETKLAAYRVLGEAIEHMVSAQPARLRVRIHCAVKRDGRGMVSMALTAVEPALTGRSSAQTARLAQLRNHVAAYGGSLHNRPRRMRLVVLDEALQARTAHARPAAAPSTLPQLESLLVGH